MKLTLWLVEWVTEEGLGYIFAINGEDPHHTLVVFLAWNQLGCLFLDSMMGIRLKVAKSNLKDREFFAKKKSNLCRSHTLKLSS